MRRWMVQVPRRGTVNAGRRVDPIRLADELRGCAGKWVALVGGRVVEVQESPDRLLMALHAREIHGAVIMRAPAEHEPEMVSFG